MFVPLNENERPSTALFTQGAALIAVGDKPAKPFRVGAQVDEGLILLAVEARRALLGPEAGRAPALTLELPPVAR